MSINDWPLAERPRERLLAHGPTALADAELLAICLRTGVRGKSAVDVARELITGFGSLRTLLSASPRELSKLPGMGNAKAAQLLASLELARRTLREEIREKNVLSTPQAVRDYLCLLLGQQDREVFIMLLLDSQHHAIGTEELFQGTLGHTSVFPREVVKCALRHNAAAVIFAHNHPSGVAEPSHADELLTRSLKSALMLVEINTLDHFIVAGSKTLSFAERGLL